MGVLSIQSTHVHQNMNNDFVFSVTILILSYVIDIICIINILEERAYFFLPKFAHTCSNGVPRLKFKASNDRCLKHPSTFYIDYLGALSHISYNSNGYFSALNYPINKETDNCLVVVLMLKHL